LAHPDFLDKGVLSATIIGMMGENPEASK